MTKADAVRADAVSCRYCGATHARPHANAFGICASCFEALERHHTVEELNDAAFLLKLARKLERQIRSGVSSFRCEAVPMNGNPRTDGYQCEMSARATLKGRHFCASHLSAKAVFFVPRGKPNRSRLADMIGFAADYSPTLRKELMEMFSP